jgi:hypothetical protein
VNGVVPKDQFFAEEGVVKVPMTDKIHFRGLEGNLKLMLMVIITIFPIVEFFRDYTDSYLT